MYLSTSIMMAQQNTICKLFGKIFSCVSWAPE